MADNTKQWSDYWVFAYLLYPDLTYQVTDRWSLDKTPTSGRELFMKYITNKKIDQTTYDGMPKAYKEAFVKDAQTGNYTLTTNNATLQRLEQNVQNNAANYTDDILKTNLPALYARTNREDAVTNATTYAMDNSANDMETVIGSGKIIPEAYEPDLSLSINGGPTGPSFTANTNTSTQQQNTAPQLSEQTDYPRDGVARNTHTTADGQQMTTYGMDTGALRASPDAVYQYAMNAQQLQRQNTQQQMTDTRAAAGEQLSQGAVPEGFNIKEVLGREPQYVTENGQKKIVLSEEDMGAVLDAFMMEQAPKIRANNQMDHITSIFADPMKDQSVASRYNAATGNAYAEMPGSESYVPFPTAGAQDLAHLLNTIEAGGMSQTPSTGSSGHPNPAPYTPGTATQEQSKSTTQATPSVAAPASAPAFSGVASLEAMRNTPTPAELQIIEDRMKNTNAIDLGYGPITQDRAREIVTQQVIAERQKVPTLQNLISPKFGGYGGGWSMPPSVGK